MRMLTGDIGGTNTRLAIVDAEHDHIRLLRGRTFASRNFPSLAAIVREFLARVPDVPGSVCFGVACPMAGGSCRSVNLPWPIDVTMLAAEIGVPHVTVVNDFHAVACAIPHLRPTDLVTLQTGEPREHGAIAVIGAGTGLGEAFLTSHGSTRSVHDSEGGHASFGARNELECDFLNWMHRRVGHVSRERVVSGPGLVSIYQYLVTKSSQRESALVRLEMKKQDPAAVISRHALEGSDPLCERALEMFTSAFGAQAANLALTVMATGGVYIAGGIAPRIVPKLRDGTFMTAFRDKGRLASMLTRIPVHVIVNPHIGLIGAAAAALDHHGARLDGAHRPASGADPARALIATTPVH